MAPIANIRGLNSTAYIVSVNSKVLSFENRLFGFFSKHLALQEKEGKSELQTYTSEHVAKLLKTSVTAPIVG